MENEKFFNGANRRVILGSPTLQVSSRRICLPVRMPLSGESFVGMPEWIGTAYEAVSRYLTEASPEMQQIGDLVIAFFNDKPSGELFAPPSAKIPAGEMRAFSVSRVGDPDGDPEVELQLKVYAPYTRDFWAWIGEMAGHEVYMAFPSTLGQGAVRTGPSGNLEDEEPSDAELSITGGNSSKVEGDDEAPRRPARRGKTGATVN